MKLKLLYGIGLGTVLLPAVAGASDWPQWRGPDRTGSAPSGSPAPATLPAEPKVLWKLDIGGGFSSPVVAGGKLVYLDAQGGRETAHLLDAKTSKEIWSVPFAEEFGDEWGSGPRSTPMIDGDRVYVQSCSGEFRCLNIADGKTVWQTSYVNDFGAVFHGNRAQEGAAMRRGNNGGGVIEGDRVILPVGSAQGASLVCFDKRTGKVLWKAGSDEAAYSSPMVATLAGVKQVVAFTAEALMGVELERGQILWRVPLATQAKRHAGTPVIVGDTVMVNSTTIGLVCFKITKDGAGQKAVPLWTNAGLRINLATPVSAGNFLFTHGASRDFVCVDALTGRQTWKQPGFGENVSAAIVLGRDLLVHTDRGELVLMAADPEKYVEKGRLQVTGKSWSHPAYADGKLYLREGVDRGWKLTCLELVP